MTDMRLSPRGRNLLLTVHLVATVSVLGTDLVLLALGVAGLRGADPRTVYPAAHLVGQWLVAPSIPRTVLPPSAIITAASASTPAPVMAWGEIRSVQRPGQGRGQPGTVGCQPQRDRACMRHHPLAAGGDCQPPRPSGNITHAKMCLSIRTISDFDTQIFPDQGHFSMST
jgi:hypothetical protein